MAKTTITNATSATKLAKQAVPKATAGQQRALADQILRLNKQQKGEKFAAGETVRLGKGYSIPQLATTTAPSALPFYEPPATAEDRRWLTDGTGSTAPSAATQWTLESDPVYQQAIAAGQSAFNVARAKALADLQNQQTQTAGQVSEIGKGAASSRERLAGSFAARGLAGGGYGALTRAEAELNAKQIAAQTSLQDQMSAVNQQYLENFGTPSSDWTGTIVGQDYRNQAIQQAMSALIPRYTGV